MIFSEIDKKETGRRIEQRRKKPRRKYGGTMDQLWLNLNKLFCGKGLKDFKNKKAIVSEEAEYVHRSDCQLDVKVMKNF